MAKGVLAGLKPLDLTDALDGITRGAVLKVDIAPVQELEGPGNEAHPCVVVSNNALSQKARILIVVPITGHSGGAKPKAYEVPLDEGDGELSKDCYAQPHLVR